MKRETKVVTLRLPVAVIQALKVIAEENGNTFTDVVTEAIAEYLEEEKTVADEAEKRVGERGPLPISVEDPIEAFAVARSINPESEPIPEPQEEEQEPEVEMCSYTEYDGDTGQTMRCGKPVHAGRVKHGNWVKVG